MRPGEIALLKIYHLSLSSLTGPLSRACMSMRLHVKWRATPNSKSGILCDTVVLNHTSKIWWMNLKNHLLCLQYKQTLNCSCKILGLSLQTSDTLAYCAHYVIVWWYAERLSSSWSTRDSSIPLLTMTITSPLRLNSLLSCNDCNKALHNLLCNLSVR